MTNTPLTVDNPFGLFDGCFVKLSNNTVVGPLFWNSDKGRFVLPNKSTSWYPNGVCFLARASIISLASTPREPVKVLEPWTIWRNYIRGGAYRGDWSEKETAISSDDGHEYTLEIECRVVRVHFPDGTTQEVK